MKVIERCYSLLAHCCIIIIVLLIVGESLALVMYPIDYVSVPLLKMVPFLLLKQIPVMAIFSLNKLRVQLTFIYCPVNMKIQWIL